MRETEENPLSWELTLKAAQHPNNEQTSCSLSRPDGNAGRHNRMGLRNPRAWGRRAHWKVPSEPNPEEGKKRTAWLSRAEAAVSSGKHRGRGSDGEGGPSWSRSRRSEGPERGAAGVPWPLDRPSCCSGHTGNPPAGGGGWSKLGAIQPNSSNITRLAEPSTDSWGGGQGGSRDGTVNTEAPAGRGPRGQRLHGRKNPGVTATLLSPRWSPEMPGFHRRKLKQREREGQAWSNTALRSDVCCTPGGCWPLIPTQQTNVSSCQPHDHTDNPARDTGSFSKLG